MPYTVCPSNPARDKTSLLDLWSRNLPTASPGRYAWLYDSGPAIAWLLKSETGDTIGSTGLMRRTVKVGANLILAGQAIDLNVDQDHRSAGPALRLQRVVVDQVKQGRLGLIYGFPDAKSEPVLRRIGYKALGTLGRWAKPLRSADHLPAWLRHRLPKKVISAVVDAIMRLASPETFSRQPAAHRVHVTDHFDARFDAIWQEAAPQFHAVGERTSAYLTWRFGRCPTVPHRVFCLTDADGRLRAYLVYSRRGPVAHVNDFFFANLKSLDLLLAAFLRRMREERAEAVIAVYFGSDTVGRKLKRFGFWRRPTDWKTMVYADPQHPGPEPAQVLDPQSWFLTHADIDTDD